jgi:hypothetical protein
MNFYWVGGLIDPFLSAVVDSDWAEAIDTRGEAEAEANRSTSRASTQPRRPISTNTIDRLPSPVAWSPPLDRIGSLESSTIDHQARSREDHQWSTASATVAPSGYALILCS